MKRSIAVFALLFIVVFAFSQSNKLYFQNLEDGLSNKFVRCIFKDSRGFMWFGTYNGLNLFDGTTFINYEHNPDDSTSICHNVINAITEDQDHNIWIATGEGLDLYNREKNNFIKITDLKINGQNYNNAYISSICVDKDGTIWLGTLGQGLIAYTRKSRAVSLYSFGKAGDQAPDNIICLTRCKDNRIWLGTRQGIYLFNISERKQEQISYKKGNNIRLDDAHISSMALDNNENLWIGITGGKLFELTGNEGKYQIKNIPVNSTAENEHDNILSLNCDAGNNLYIGKENGGLAVLNIASGNITQYSHEEGNPVSLASTSIWAIYFDNNDKIWLGTYNKGVCLADKYYKKFDNYQRNSLDKNTLAANDVKSFSVGGHGNIWVGTDGGGISIFNEKENKFIRTLNTSSNPKLSSNAVTSILHDSRGRTWIGYWAGGIDLLSSSGSKIKNLPVRSNGAGDNNILCIYEDKKHDIWAGTAASGLFFYDTKHENFRLIPASKGMDVPPTSYVTSILEDNDATIWVGTLYGLFAVKRLKEGRYSTKSYYRNNMPGSISSNQINTIFEDHDHNVWFGTFDNGLNLLDKKQNKFKIYRKKDGLASNTINGILEDDNGNLWISTNKGITKFNPDIQEYTSYSKEDGLVTNEFYPGSCMSTGNDIFFFGGDNGFNSFCPDSIIVNPVKPIMYFTRLMINNEPVKIGGKDSPLSKSISETRRITLNHKQTSVTVGYIGVGYTRTSRNQYAYKLVGFDDTWKNAGNRTSVTYTNLSPGNYRLLVKGANNDGIWSNKPAELMITVKPPYWKTWWALLSYLILVSLAIAFIVRLRIERIKIKNTLAIERLAREKDQELNQAKLQFFTNISHEFRTPLSLILGPLESINNSSELNTNIKSQILTVRKNATRLLQLINELMDFRKIENRKMQLKVSHEDIHTLISDWSSYFAEIAQKRGITYNISFSDTDIQGWIDRNKLEKILNNILSNAFKYTPDKGSISINTTIGYQNKQVSGSEELTDETTDIQYLYIQVNDNGKGIQPEDMPYIFDRFYQAKSSTDKGTGIGLTLVKSLVEIHHGNIKAESIPSSATRFTVSIPISRAAYSPDEMTENLADIPDFEKSIYVTGDGKEQKDQLKDQDEEKPELLVVEDNDELSLYLAHELKDQYRVSIARNGRVGLEMAISQLPDLIISDVMMPEMDGVELCRTIKTDASTSHIPVILLTAKSAVEDQIKGIEEGADVYITKPFSIQLMKAQISHMINSRKDLYTRFSQEVHIIPAQYAKNKLDQEFLSTIIDYIVSNISDSQLGVEALADSMNLSRGQIYRKIKALTGKTAVEFIRDIRLKEAVKLMETRKLSLAEIAYETGFTSPSYFTRSFKSQYGKAPSDYMKS